MTPDEQRLYDHLREGKANARTQAQLAESCGWFTPRGAPDTRKVQTVLTRLRDNHGIIFASSCRAPMGTYLVADEAELAEYKAVQFSRIKKIIAGIRKIDTAWERELTNELFHPCKSCGRIIGRDTEYCDRTCREEFHTRARVAGYSLMGVT